jgi:Ca2+-binding EF-hand superfamily protein
MAKARTPGVYPEGHRASSGRTPHQRARLLPKPEVRQLWQVHRTDNGTYTIRGGNTGLYMGFEGDPDSNEPVRGHPRIAISETDPISVEEWVIRTKVMKYARSRTLASPTSASRSMVPAEAEARLWQPDEPLQRNLGKQRKDIFMSDSVKNRKFNILFDWFDQGRDGYLTHDDFQQFAALFTALPGGDAPENAQALRGAFEKWWGLLLAEGDTTEDKRLEREEFIEVMKSNVTAPENFEDAVITIADAFMRIVDTSGDGSLKSDEYVRMYEGLGIDPAHSSDAFRRLDRDGDNAISYEEFRTAIVEFYLSDDENAPGNWLLGPPN